MILILFAPVTDTGDGGACDDCRIDRNGGGRDDTRLRNALVTHALVMPKAMLVFGCN